MKSIVTVTTAATSYNLTTLERVLAELQIENPTAAQQALLEIQIEEASAAISTYCNRVFPAETVSELFWHDPTATNARGGGTWGGQFWGWGNSGPGVEKLRLDRYPTISITSVTQDGVAVDASLYRVDDKSGFLYALDSSGYPDLWFFGKNITVAYRGGYTTIPVELERAARLWVSDSFFSSGQDPRIKSETVFEIGTTVWSSGGSSGVTAQTSESGLPGGVEALLLPYRRMPVA